MAPPEQDTIAAGAVVFGDRDELAASRVHALKYGEFVPGLGNSAGDELPGGTGNPVTSLVAPTRLTALARVGRVLLRSAPLDVVDRAFKAEKRCEHRHELFHLFHMFYFLSSRTSCPGDAGFVPRWCEL